MLPETEFVAMQRSGLQDVVLVPWVALRDAGLLPPEPGMTPPRWRVGRYLDDLVLERLFAAGATIQP